MKYKVQRRHLGDRLYEEGDEREASPSEVAHLVDRGILKATREKHEAEAKDAGAAPLNKAVEAPENKAAPAAKQVRRI